MAVDSLSFNEIYYGRNQVSNTGRRVGNPYANLDTSLFADNDTNKTAKAVATVAGIGIAAALAFVFRGKIKGGLTKVVTAVKPHATKIWNAVKSFGTTVLKKGQKLYQDGMAFVKPHATKVWNAIKSVGTKIVAFFKK